jgi:hypothetical protein
MRIATERDEVPKPHRLMLPWNGVKVMLPHDAWVNRPSAQV